MTSEKRKNSPNGRVNPDFFPCPICGDEDFVWGYTTGYSTVGFRFVEYDNAKFKHGKWIKARECNRCGNVQLFTKTKDDS